VLLKNGKMSEKKHAGTAKVAAVADKKRSGIVNVSMVPKKRRTETVMVTVTQGKGGLKRLSDTDIASVRSVR
jgi:hypothetical protein